MMISRIKKFDLTVLFLLLIVMITASSCEKEDDEAKQAAIDQALIEEYVANNQIDGQFTVSGLYYSIIEEGNGNYPLATSVVKVTYKGYLLDGTVFDEGHISATPLSNLIIGWQEGIRKIGEGGEIKLIIPSHLAYGEQSTEEIPIFSVLVFDITLHAFE